MEFSKFKFSHFLERISAYLNEEKTATKPFLQRECLEISLVGDRGVNAGQQRSFEAGTLFRKGEKAGIDSQKSINEKAL